jgi:hypothetical protein
VGANGAGGVAKTGLPEDSQVEKPFHEYHGGRVTHGVPRNEAAFGKWQQAVRKSSSDTTSIQVDDLAVLAAWEDHSPTKGVTALGVDQTNVEQRLERMAESGQMAA